MEQRLGGQFGFGDRLTLLSQVGYASRTDSLKSSVEAWIELIANLFDRSAGKVFALGLGRRTRALAANGGAGTSGRRLSQRSMGSDRHLRLERVVGRDAVPGGRDGIDVITTAGATHAVGSVVRIRSGKLYYFGD
jgi:hypothetical protein